MERKQPYGGLFVFKFKLLNPQLRVHVYKKWQCFSLRDILVACRETGSLPEQVKQKENLSHHNIHLKNLS